MYITAQKLMYWHNKLILQPGTKLTLSIVSKSKRPDSISTRSEIHVDVTEPLNLPPSNELDEGEDAVIFPSNSTKDKSRNANQTQSSGGDGPVTMSPQDQAAESWVFSVHISFLSLPLDWKVAPLLLDKNWVPPSSGKTCIPTNGCQRNLLRFAYNNSSFGYCKLLILSNFL